MQTEWVKVYVTSNPVEAEIIVAMLRDQEVDAVSMNKRDSSYLAFGYVEVYCRAEDVVKAKHLIANPKHE